MNLMQEKEDNKKDIFSAVLVFGVMPCAMLAFILGVFVIDLGVSEMYKACWYLVDAMSLLPLLVTTVLALCAARLWKPFFRVFGILFSHRKYSASEIKESGIALRMAGNVWMVTGILVTSLGLVICLNDLSYDSNIITKLENPVTIAFINIAISSLGLFYGAVGKLFLLPIQSKLEVIAEKLSNQV